MFQLDSGFYVTDDTCTHGEASKFCIEDGKATAFPAIEPTKVYKTQVVDGRVCIEAAQA